MSKPKKCTGCNGSGLEVQKDFNTGEILNEFPCFICNGTGEFISEKYTCHTCNYKKKCPYAWDMYNLDGNCLNNK